MNTEMTEGRGSAGTSVGSKARRLPPELSILVVLAGIALVFELLGWILIGQSFLVNLFQTHSM